MLSTRPIPRVSRFISGHRLGSSGKSHCFNLLIASYLLNIYMLVKQCHASSCLRRSSTSEDSIPPLLQRDVRLGPQGNSAALFSVSGSPLAGSHNWERPYQLGGSCQGYEYKVDFVFISELPKGYIDSDAPNTPLIFSHHACHCSLSSLSPISISWLVDGPQTIQHNFSASL
ncbi:hypothetical protein DITRI_Ditri12bG0125000 [Diplodiscus trichospermus]